MRIHFDDQIVMHQPRGGVSRYFVELVETFRHEPDLGVTADLDWRATRNVHAVDAGLGPTCQPDQAPVPPAGSASAVAARAAH